MMILLTLLIAISFSILFINIIFIFLFPTFTKKPYSSNNHLNISVIVAFKNEEKNLENLFSSLEALDYPKEKFEVILVDDNSSDNSYQKAVELSHLKANYRVLKAGNKVYPGKRGALDIGINSAKHMHILITDADCMPENKWLIGYSQKFTAGYELLFGLAPFKQYQTLINKIACFENLRSSFLTFAFAKLGIPYSAAARNFGFTIGAYQKLGGFTNTLETPSGDDDLLIREAVKNKLKIGVVDFKDCYVFSESKNSLSEFLNQKARHTKTALHYLPIHKILLGLWHLLNILTLASIFLLSLDLLFVLPFIIKLLIDMILVLSVQMRFKYDFKIHEIIYLQLMYELALIVNFFLSFRKNIVWKI